MVGTLLLVVNENQLEENTQQKSLSFKQVAPDIYRVFNSATGRFHNIELGIDWVV